MKISSPSLFKLSFIAFALVQVHSSYAAETALPVIELQADSGDQSSEHTKSYIVKKSSSATKLDISAQETPQTVNVVTRQQMDDYHLTSTRDVLNNTPGVTVTGLETNRTTYTARGLDISNILVDGIGIPQVDSYNYNGSDADSYFYDRIEIVKGADALTNALGDPGATINYIRKKPTKDFQASADVSYGSWDTQRYEADVSGSLTKDGRVRGRLVGYEQTGNSYLDGYSEEKNGFQANIEADLTDSTLLSAGYSKTHQYTNGSQWGSLPLVNDAGQQLSYSRSYNYAPSWTYYDWDIDNYFANLEQKIGDNWKLNLGYNLKRSKLTDKMLNLGGLPSASDNTSGANLYSEIYNQNFRETTATADLQGKFHLFGRDHEADIGYNWSQYNVTSVYAYGSNYGASTTDLASWSPQEPTWGDMQYASPTRYTLKTVYAATRLHLTDDLKLTLGSNYTKINGDSYNKDKVSPYAGLTYNFTPEYTGYMSYTSIFRPQTFIDEATGKTAVPVVGKSYEIGVKSSWLDGRLTGNLAVFRTDEDNFALNPTYSYSLNTYTSPIGTLRSQGVELGLTGNVTDNLNLIFGFSTFSLKDMDDGSRARPNIPTQTINILATYTVPQIPKLQVGAGMRWQDDITDTSYSTVRQSAYTLFDLMASYEINDHISMQLNAKNITNEKYLTGLSGGQGYYGAPANYTVAFKFKY